MRLATLLFLPFLLASCLENEEEIVVHADGTVEVTLTARGDAADLGAGHAIPMDGPWQPAGGHTAEWLEHVGRDTGSADTRARLAGGVAGELWGEDDVVLRVQGAFPALAEVPASLAPDDAPHRDAYLRRRGTLEVRRAGSATVYVLERTYELPSARLFDPLRRLEQMAPAPLRKKWQDGARGLGEAGWSETLSLLRASFVAVGEQLARDALLPTFTEGSAPLRAADLVHVVDRVRRRVAAAISDERLADLRHFVESDQAGGVHPDELKERAREAVRDALGDGLRELGAAPEVVQAALERLEQRFTAVDHASDLADERFRVAVRLPGTLVGGDHERVEDGRAVWEFDGARLEQGAVVMRAVSVVE